MNEKEKEKVVAIACLSHWLVMTIMTTTTIMMMMTITTYLIYS